MGYPNYRDIQAQVLQRQQNAPRYNLKLSNKAINPVDFSNLKVSASSKPPSAASSLFTKALTTLGGVGKVVTTQLGNWTDGKLDWKDFPLAEQMGMAERQIKKDWNSSGLLGKLAAPIKTPFNVLYGIGKEGKGFDQTLGNLGVKNEGVKKWGGLAGDILLDPLTWVTGGGAAASKAGLKAATPLSKALAVEHGVTGGKNVFKTMDNIISSGKVAAGSPEHIQMLNKINSVVKPARKAMDDSLLAFNVPFTNIVKGIGKKPQSMVRSSPVIGQMNEHVVRQTLENLGLSSAKKQSQFLGKVVGKTNPADLTISELRHIQDEASRLGKIEGASAKTLVKGDSLALQRSIPDMVHTIEGRKAIPMGSVEYGKLGTMPNAKIIPNPAIKKTDEMLKYVEDAGGVSKLGEKIRAPFDSLNARTLKSDNPLVRNAANAIQDAATKKQGWQHVIQMNTDKLRTMTKGFSDDELKAVTHMMENKFPKGQTFEQWSQGRNVSQRKVSKVVRFLQNEFDSMAKAEVKAGTLSHTIDNYVPHIFKGKEDEVSSIAQKYKNDPQIQKIIGKSSANKFDRTRKGLDTFAEYDDSIVKLQDELAKAKTPEKAKGIQEKIDDLSNLFERDPVKIYGQRMYESIKGRAMKEMQDSFRKDGLMKSVAKGESSSVKEFANLKPLSPADAKAFGLKEGTHYMHPEVLKAFKETEALFTDEGMNKLLANMQGATNIWRSFVTTSLPTHYMNNFIGNVATNAMAGVSGKSYVSAGKLLNKMKTGSLSKTEQQLMDKAFDAGVFNGFTSDFLPAFKTENKLEKFAEKVRNNPWSKTISKYGEKTDDITRFAHYVDVYHKTGSFEKAAESVRKYLFNYGEITKHDRAIRAVVPFWNWTKRNIPLQLNKLLSTPRYASTYNKIKESLQGDDKGRLPSWLQESGIRLPFTDKFIDPHLPVQDLNNLGNGTPVDLMKFGWSSSNPLAKMSVELPLNKQFYTGKPIDYNKDKAGEYNNGKLAEYLVNQTGIFGKLAKPVFNDNTSVADALQSLFIPKTYSPK